MSVEVILVLVISALCLVKAQDYCDNTLCNGVSHLACRHSGVRITKENFFPGLILNIRTVVFFFLPLGSPHSSLGKRRKANNSQHAQFSQVNIDCAKTQSKVKHR